jgi:hypothetical protein
MKKQLIPLFTLFYLALGLAHAAEKVQTPAERFYGKIVSIDPSQRFLTVHNNRQKQDAMFQWDGETGITLNREPIKPSDLKIGQSLIVSYVAENDVNKAKRITVRTPFKKSQR